MKKVVIGSLLIIVSFAYSIYLNAKVDELEQYINALGSYTKAAIYKKDAQLYLMNAVHGNEDMHKALADSCKNDCLKYKIEKYKNNK